MKVGIYLRCSTEARERATLEVQKEQCINYCKRDDWNQYEIYSDDGVSGAIQDRPEFQRLLRDLESGEVGTMLVWRLDRFSRNIRDAVNIIEDLKNWNCSFVSVCERIDLRMADGAKIRDIWRACERLRMTLYSGQYGGLLVCSTMGYETG